jgi:hypothetical protein
VVASDEIRNLYKNKSVAHTKKQGAAQVITDIIYDNRKKTQFLALRKIGTLVLRSHICAQLTSHFSNQVLC